MKASFAKTVCLGMIQEVGRSRRSRFFCHVAWTPKLHLSVTGVIGPRYGGNCDGACGQVIMEFRDYDKRGYSRVSDIDPAKGWTPAMIRKFFDFWDKWHLKAGVPDEVLEWFKSLPAPERQPAWV